VATSKLFYAGNSMPIYAHFMPWFGGSNHMSVGYASADAAQVKRQVNDLLSRGITGVVIDWYGPNFATENNTTLYMKQEAETRNGGFVFAVMEDAGALSSCINTRGCNVTSLFLNHLTYAYNTYMASPAYMRVGGRPLVFEFGIGNAVDWNTVAANAPGNPIFVRQDTSGFWQPASGGAFTWVHTNADHTNIALDSLDYFYSNSLNYASLQAFGGAWKGFNDTLASWGQNRIMNQNCGQTWLQTAAEAGKYFSSSSQLDFVQLVTWNDYEEGTEIESGIDNCVSVSATMAGTALNWNITGSENTLDHYTAFVSVDGQNLMPLADVPAGTHTYDVANAGLVAGSYTFYVKAVGKPSIANHMSGAVTAALGTTGITPSLSVTPNSGSAPLVVTASTSGSTDVGATITSSSIDFGDGSSAAGPSASHSYGNAGSYTVRATVNDSTGASATASQIVSVTGNVGMTLSSPANNGSYNANVHLVASAVSNNAANPIGFLRVYVDDLTAWEAAVSSVDTYLAMNTGQHHVVAQAWDAIGTLYRAEAYINVANQAPVAALSLSPTSGVAPVTVNASTAASSDADGSIAASTIDFGDGTIANGPTASHSYSAAGTYTVTARVTDNFGATGTASGTVTVTTPAPPPPTTPTGSVTISSPAPGPVRSPLNVAASATASPNPITAMRVYVDGASVYSVNAASLNTSVSVSKGKHTLLVNAWDSSGAVFQSSVSFNVVNAR
jgi:PKD repeat protein